MAFCFSCLLVAGEVEEELGVVEEELGVVEEAVEVEEVASPSPPQFTEVSLLSRLMLLKLARLLRKKKLL